MQEGKPPVTPLCVADFDWLGVIGCGSFGEVWKARRKSSNNIQAIKIVDKLQVCKMRLLDQIMQEKSILTAPNHRAFFGFNKLYSTFQDLNSLYFVSEFCDRGDLAHVVHQSFPLPEELVIYLGAQLVTILDYLHRSLILFRDFKPENLLLSEGFQVRLCDFGSAVILPNAEATVKTLGGTAAYIPPEFEKGVGLKGDLWAFGCTLSFLLTGTVLFQRGNDYTTIHAVLNREFQLDSRISTYARSLLEEILVQDPAERLSIEGIKAHPFFAGVNWPAFAQGPGHYPPLPDSAVQFQTVYAQVSAGIPPIDSTK